jgi:hypothetical protein
MATAAQAIKEKPHAVKNKSPAAHPPGKKKPTEWKRWE